jgi:hypothetical protein
MNGLTEPIPIGTNPARDACATRSMGAARSANISAGSPLLRVLLRS